MYNSIVIGATNRKDDIDYALLSRFDTNIHFDLPNLEERASIFGNYAKHLGSEELGQLAERSDGCSGRNIKDICEAAERRWARKLISGEQKDILPEIEEYYQSIENRKENGI